MKKISPARCRFCRLPWASTAIWAAGITSSSHDEACALAGLGRCALAAGHTTRAADMLRQALEIFQQIGAAETADVSRELNALIKAGPTE